jgi:hypothetical protein
MITKNEKYYYLENLSWSLDILMTEPCNQIGNLLNHSEHPDSQITDITHSPLMYFDEEKDDLIELSEEELKTAAFVGDQITFEGPSGTVMTFKTVKGYFTVLELVRVIVEFEKHDRPKTNWFGGIDTHHIYFEGIASCNNGIHSIYWGS